MSALFDPRLNALNAVRLILAISVIGWHSFPLSGETVGFAPLRQLFERVGVDAFFAISGFLIVSSWIRNPNWREFLTARLLRIMPAFWVCLIVVAAIFAPLSIVLRGADLPEGFVGDAADYVLRNSLLRMSHYDVADTPVGVPFPGAWNGSLWTLFWEFLCYLGVLVLGIAGLLRFRVTIPLLFVGAMIGVLATSYGPIDNYWIDRASRLGIMFVAGAVVYRFQDRLPLSWGWIGIAAGVTVLASLLPDYRIVAAVPLAYAVIGIGALIKRPRLVIRNDISYGVYIYGFPVQQLFATIGLTSLGVPLFALVALAGTVPLAAASWFLVEKPAMRLRRRQRPQPVQDAAPSATPPTGS